MKKTLFVGFVSALAWSGYAAGDPVALSGVQGGVVVHVNCAEGSGTVSLKKSAAFVVQGLSTDAVQVAAARAKYRDVSFLQYDGDHLPYIDGLVNLIVLDGDTAPKTDEIKRVLAPRGVVVNADGRKLYTQPVPPEIDEWTHYMYSAGGNPVSSDTKVGIPDRIQWQASPWWSSDHDTDAGLNAMVSAQGRLFAIVNDSRFKVPMMEVPDRWFLIARDAYNGALLWKKPITDWGWRSWKKTYAGFKDTPLQAPRRLVAVGDRVYATLGYKAPISEIDAATGKVIRTLPGSEYTDELAATATRVIASVNTEPPQPEGYSPKTKPMADTYPPKILKAYKRETGKLLWKIDKIRGSSNTNTACDKYGREGLYKFRLGGAFLNVVATEKAVCYLDLKELVMVDAATGRQRWRTTVADEGEARAGALRIVGDLVYLGEDEQLCAFKLSSGKENWAGAHSDIQWNTWRDYFVRDGVAWVWSPEEGTTTLRAQRPNLNLPAPQGKKREKKYTFPKALRGYDGKSGDIKTEHDLGAFYAAPHHHRCYQNKASARYVLTGRLGIEFVDFETGELAFLPWARGGCQYGIMPANGMIYTPPHSCWCYSDSLVNGFNALVDSTVAQRNAFVDLKPVLEKGPAYASEPGSASGKSDWPTFRGNALRGAINPDGLNKTLIKPIWTTPLGTGLTAPVIANGKVFAAAGNDVVCLNAATGQEVWRATAGGWIDSPPTIASGRVLFGARDGTVTALRADDGQTVWCFHTSDRVYQHGHDGRLESILPVHGAVLVHDGKVFFTAGRNANLDAGVTAYALDLKTGQVENSKTFRFGREPRTSLLPVHSENAHESNGMKNGIASTDGRLLFVQSSSLNFNFSDRHKGDPKHKEGEPNNLLTFRNMLDEVVTKRSSWMLPKSGAFGQMLCFNEEEVFGAKMVNTIKFLTYDEHFQPARKGFHLFGKRRKAGKPAWQIQQPIIVTAMAATANLVFYGGAPDEIDPNDPLKNYEGRGAGKLLVLDRKTGEVKSAVELPSGVVFNGIAISGAEVVLSLKNGSVMRLAP